MIILAQMLILVLAGVKIASVVGWLPGFEVNKATDMLAATAFAQPKAAEDKAAKSQTDAEKKKDTKPDYYKTPPAVKDAMEDILAQQRDLAAALAAKKAELDQRENVLRAEEQRLIAMRRDITEKIAILKTQEEKLAAQMDAEKEEDIKRYKEMAKVYENTPPAKAGPMMEKLDTKTAAGITMNMKKDKAGALWAYITPNKAVEITRQITRSGGYKNE